mgnify:CR=1 FL=1
MIDHADRPREDNFGHSSKRYRVIFTFVLLALAWLSLTTSSVANENWPQFRGPTMNATVADNPNLPERWSRTENVEWVAEVPGIGWSSPVVWGNRVFLTTVTADGDFEQPKPGLYAPRGRPEPPKVEQDWRIYCFDLETGDVLWQRSVLTGEPNFPRHQKNSVPRPANPVAKLAARLTSTWQARASASLPCRGLRDASHSARQSR